jgi:hypothetical protein
VTSHIAILVEGATEGAFKKVLQRFLQDRVAASMPKLDFVVEHGRIPKEDKLKRVVQRLLNKNDAVIALTDVYTGGTPRDFTDAADAKAKMANWVGAEDRFHPHAAQHDFEAWLLPYWPRIQALAGSNRQPPSLHPESVNHGKLPAYVLADVFRSGTKRRAYSKTRDAEAILRDQDLSVSAEKCPELKAFLNTILKLMGGEPL